MRFQGRSGREITDLESWREFGGPARADHWVDGRSAKCLAEAWLADGAERLSALLATARGGRLGHFTPEVGIAEAQTRFDHFAGGRRNHDLLVIGECSGGKTVVGIEGKVDESFGPTVVERLAAADARLARGGRSNARARVERLLAAIDRSRSHEVSRSAGLRYQLFTAVAGTLAAAVEHQAVQAVFCVQELATEKADPAKRVVNGEDLRAFATAALGLEVEGDEDWIVGPARVPGSDLVPGAIPIWVAHLRSSSAATA